MRRSTKYKLAVAEACLARIADQLERIPAADLSNCGFVPQVIEMDCAIGAWRRGFMPNHRPIRL